MFVVWYSVVVVLLHQAATITASLKWPGGIYALPKPKTGCPKEWKDNGWEENGWIDRVTSSNRPSNDKSENLNMAAYVERKKVKIYFCISKATKSTNRLTWPKGEYCIYSKDNIQNTGTKRGHITMHDWYSKTSTTDTCKKSFFYEWQKYKRFYFKCQTSGNKKIPIALPITKPFYLLPYGSRDCQQVKWMVATTEWIKDYTYRYGYQYDQIPHLDLKSYRYWKELKMYYCYYKSCNYTLNDTSGVFQSPGFPAKYPDGQMCSWRIMVPDNHTLVIDFTKFSLYEYDEDILQLYEYKSRIFKLNQIFFGHHRPFTITVTSDVMFVFRSDDENNSSGFRAEYEIFKTPERTTTAKPPTTTAKPPTTTAHPTTTTQPTTKLIITQPMTREASTTNVNSTTNETVQCNPNPTKDKSHNKRYNHPLQKKTCFCDETWRIVVMVIPLAVFVLIVLVTIDIFCRCRYKKALKTGAGGSSANDGMVINPTYERGNIILDQSAETVTDETTVDDQPQSRDELPDYEDVDYTQVNEIPLPRRSTKRQECYALQPVGNDTSSVFYHVLELPKTQSNRPQSQVPELVGNGAPEVFYNTLEPPTASNRPTYQNLSEVKHYKLNPVYESAENSAPLVEANNLYDNYIA